MEESTNLNESGDALDDVAEMGGDLAAVWTEKLEERFIKIMEDEVIKGNKAESTFSKSAWLRIRGVFNAQSRKSYSNIQLRNKFNQLRIREREFSKLIKEPGINYNSVTSTVTASEEVWLRLHKVNKSATKFRKKGCPFFSKLCLIYGDATGSSSDLQCATRSVHEIDNEVDVENLNISTSFGGDQSDVVGTQSTDATQNCSDTPSSSNRGKRTTCAPNAYPDHSKRKADLMERNMTIVSSGFDFKSDSPRKMLIKESMRALNALVDIDGAAYARAVERFHDDQLWMELFLEMPMERRKDWILNLK